MSDSSFSMARFQQQGFQLDQNFGAPILGLPSIGGLVEPLAGNFGSEASRPANASTTETTATATEPGTASKLMPAGKSLTDETPVANQVDTKGDAVQEVSNATAQTVAPEQDYKDLSNETFFGSYWPYLMVVVALVGWGIAQLFLKRPPNFKHNVIVKPEASETGPKLSGQFKVSQRFQKSKDEDKTETNEVSEKRNSSKTNKASLPDQNQTVPAANPTLSDQRPTDEEFDLEFGGQDSDANLMDELESAEIVADIDSQETKTPSARFKTKTKTKTNQNDQV